MLAIAAQLGVGGGTGCVIEYAGEAIRALDMEGRMTVCNMSIEMGARAGMIAPDETTIAWLRNRPHAPRGAAFDARGRRVARARQRRGRGFDREVHIDAAADHADGDLGHDARYRDCARRRGSRRRRRRRRNALFIIWAPRQAARSPAGRWTWSSSGSCTNGRLPDLRAAAAVLRGRKVKDGVRMLVVPGSEKVRRDAEAEGLHDVFRAAGAEWRLPGCSMCIAMNGDMVGPGQLAVSTSNRNFEGRQGAGARTVLVSPATAAASAVAGVIADPRAYLEAAHA